MSFAKSALVAVDIDGTLINHKGELNFNLVKKLQLLWEEGCVLLCWSHGGEQYAVDILERFGIRGMFSTVMEKPFFAIDDLEAGGIVWRTAEEA